MPAYGLGYGIGQALAGVPDAFMQGQQMGLDRQQQQLKIQQQQQAVDEYNASQRILSQEPAKAGLGYGQEEEEGSPYLEQAKIADYRAKMFSQKGLGNQAEAYRQKAQSLHQDHIGWIGMNVAKDLKIGDFEKAKARLRAMGSRVESIAIDPEDEDYFIITTPGENGKSNAKRVSAFDLEVMSRNEKDAYKFMGQQTTARLKAGAQGNAAERRGRITLAVAKLGAESRIKAAGISAGARIKSAQLGQNFLNKHYLDRAEQIGEEAALGEIEDFRKAIDANRGAKGATLDEKATRLTEARELAELRKGGGEEWTWEKRNAVKDLIKMELSGEDLSEESPPPAYRPPSRGSESLRRPKGDSVPPIDRLDRKGEETHFANGQVWKLAEGKPVRVK